MAENSTLDECKKALDSMATKDFTNDLLSLIKSRYPLIYLTTNEERRMLRYFKYLSRVNGYRTYIWDCFMGLVDIETMAKVGATTDDIKEPHLILEYIINEAKKEDPSIVAKMREDGIKGNIYILLDYHRYLEDAPPDIERRIKRFAQLESITTVIATGPHYVTTPVLEDAFALIDFPLPNKEEIANALWSVVNTPSVSSKIPSLKRSEEHT